MFNMHCLISWKNLSVVSFMWVLLLMVLTNNLVKILSLGNKLVNALKTNKQKNDNNKHSKISYQIVW